MSTTPRYRSLALITALAVAASGAVAAPAMAAEGDSSVRITEFQYNGSEFVEFTNLGSAAVDLAEGSGWSFADSGTSAGAVPLASLGEIAPGESFLLAEKPAADFRYEWGLPASVKVIGGNTVNLGRGDTVKLFDGSGELADQLVYGDNVAGVGGPRTDDASAWPNDEDVLGANTAANWTKSTEGDLEGSWTSRGGFPGSPGTSRFSAAPLALPTAVVVVNEVNYDASITGAEDAIELINIGLAGADLSGWKVSDDHGYDYASIYTVPGGTSLAPGAFLGIHGDDVDFTFGLGKGDEVNVYDATGALVDSYAYANTSESLNWSRLPDGYGDWTAGAATIGAPNAAYEAPTPPTAAGLRINEVDSQPSDWVEFYNPGAEALDISGYEIRDNSDDHRWRFAAGSSIAAGAFLVVEADTTGLVFENGEWVEDVFAAPIGIGSADQIRLYDATGTLIDQTYAWSHHAAVGNDAAGYTLAREVDGVGGFLLAEISKGASNAGTVLTPAVQINEINSNGGPNDYIEVINTSGAAIDLTGWYAFDDSTRGVGTETFPLAAGTVLAAGARFVFSEGTHFTFGLGNGDQARIFTGAGTLVDAHAYPAHAANGGVWSAIPEGSDTFVQTGRTPGAPNNEDGENPTEPGSEYDPLPWPGGSAVTVLDTTAAFLEDSSGLDTWTDETGTYLYAVDNGTGRFWKLAVEADGTFAFADGWADGKRVRFQKDAANPTAAGPDTEGITVDGDGFVYVASERDNSAKSVNWDVILKVDPNATGPDLVALNEWDITAHVPVGANLGIEAVEWVADADLEGSLWDTALNKPYDPADYPGHGDGLFFVAVEDGGAVHAFALSDAAASKVATFTPGLSGVMALDWDTVRGGLWTVCDDGCGGVSAFVELNGTASPDVTFYARPAGAPVDNAEGFATAPAALATGGTRPAWWFTDGVKPGALRTGTLGESEGSEPLTIDIVDINDFHGRIDDNTVNFAGTVEQIRAQNPTGTVFVSAGDNIGASLFASASQQDQPTIDVLNALDLDVSAVGNHEFDQGYADLVGRVTDAADFPLLGANVYLAGTETAALPEYEVVDVDGVQVGFVGVVTEETPTLVSPGGITAIDFGDPVAALNRVTAQLLDGEAGNGEADLVVALAHEGANSGTPENSTIEQEIAVGGAFSALVKETDPRVAAILTGHTHKQYAWDAPIYVDGVATADTRPIVQTGNYGEFVGHVSLTIDPQTFAVESYTAVNVARTTTDKATLISTYPRVAEVDGIVTAALAEATVLGGQPVGEITADITTAHTGGSYVDGVWVASTRDDRASESTLGNLVANSLRDSLADTSRGGAQIGVVNAGGLRSELRYAGSTGDDADANGDGVITYAEANSVLPFLNNLWTVTLTGAQLDTLLEQQWQPTGSSRSYLALGLSDNVTWVSTTSDVSAGAPRGDNVSAIYIDGVQVAPDDEITIGTFSFLATGGDNFTVFTEGTGARDSGLVDRDAWIAYLGAQSPITPSFARTRAVVAEAPAATVAGGTLSFTVSGLDLTSLGSPQNTAATVTVGGTPLGTTAVSGGAADIAVTLPASLTAGAHVATVTAQPSGTAVTVPFTVTTGTLTAPVPTVTGTAKVGQKLTAQPGTWTPAPVALSYQWLRNGTAITGATSSSYTLTVADQGAKVAVTVTGTKTGYTTTSQTSTAQTVAAGTLGAATPTVTGTAKVGQKLTAKPGTWTPAPVALSYQWLRDGKTIKNATKSTYTLVAADRGTKITVRVTGSKSGYTTVKKTSAAKTVKAGTLTAKTPKITGTAVVGRTLKATIGTWKPAGITRKVQWYRDGKAIRGATKTSYTLVRADRGARITVTVTGSKAGYAKASKTSAATARVR